MDNYELTELQQAERFAREFLDSPYALFKTRLLARVFLAQQARLAEVERERQAWKDDARQAVRVADAAVDARMAAEAAPHRGDGRLPRQ